MSPPLPVTAFMLLGELPDALLCLAVGYGRRDRSSALGCPGPPGAHGQWVWVPTAGRRVAMPAQPWHHIHPAQQRTAGARSPSLSSASPASFALSLIELFFLSLVFALRN